VGFEFAVELSFPISEDLVAALLNISAQAFGIVLIAGLSAGPMEGPAGIWALAVALAVALALALAIRAESRRQDAQKLGGALPRASPRIREVAATATQNLFANPLAQPRLSSAPASDIAAASTVNDVQSPYQFLLDSAHEGKGKVFHGTKEDRKYSAHSTPDR
jgi:hypothetical protein